MALRRKTTSTGRLEVSLKSSPPTDDKQMMVKIFLRIPAAVLAFLMLAGCGSGEFSVNQTLESRPVQLDGEQVVLDPGTGGLRHP